MTWRTLLALLVLVLPGLADINIAARCDGVSDDQAAIQAAFASCTNTSAVLPAGNCLHSAALVITTNGCTLKGQGTTKTTLTGTTPVSNVVEWNGTSGGGAQALTIACPTCTSRTLSNQGAGLLCHNCSSWEVAGVVVTGAAQVGIIAEGTTPGSSDISIHDSRVSGTQADGVSCQNNFTRCSLRNNVLINTGDDGFSFVNYSTDPARARWGFAVGNLSVRSKADCGRDDGALDIYFVNNICDTPAAHGLILSTTVGFRTSGATAIGNIIANVLVPGHNPINVSSTDNVVLTRNTVQNSLPYLIARGSTNILLDQETISGALASAIQINGGDTNVNVIHTTVDHPAGAAMNVDSLTKGFFAYNAFLGVQNGADRNLFRITITNSANISGTNNQITSGGGPSQGVFGGSGNTSSFFPNQASAPQPPPISGKVGRTLQ